MFNKTESLLLLKKQMMYKKVWTCFFTLLIFITVSAQKAAFLIEKHPDSRNWAGLFKSDLSDADFPEGVWSFNDGILTATEDQCIWTKTDFNHFILDLEFKTAEGTNSGVIVYCTNTENWIPNSVEIQIADDFAEQWASADRTWQCAAIFGHLPASESRVKKPGKWNRITILCRDQWIQVLLNGKSVTVMDMALWTSATKNPDGTDIPSWLSTPFSELKTVGKIGLQGKHAGAPIYFRNIRINRM